MSDHPTPLGGTCSARFEPLRELFAVRTDSASLTFFRQRIADFQSARPDRASLTAELGRLCPQGR
jgi:hypothetical protein